MIPEMTRIESVSAALVLTEVDAWREQFTGGATWFKTEKWEQIYKEAEEHAQAELLSKSSDYEQLLKLIVVVLVSMT
jgi:hypothetical protein